MLFFLPALLTSLHANFSIIAACIPFSKPIIDSLAIGAITNDINDHRGWLGKPNVGCADGYLRYNRYISGNRKGIGGVRKSDRVGGGQIAGRVYTGWKGNGVISRVVSGKETSCRRDTGLELQEQGLESDGSLDRVVIHRTTVIRQISTSDAENAEMKEGGSW